MIKKQYYNGYENWATWSAMISLQKKPVSNISERKDINSFDKLLKQVLKLQTETDHGVDWSSSEIHKPTIDKALSDWPCLNIR